MFRCRCLLFTIHCVTVHCPLFTFHFFCVHSWWSTCITLQFSGKEKLLLFANFASFITLQKTIIQVRNLRPVLHKILLCQVVKPEECQFNARRMRRRPVSSIMTDHDEAQCPDLLTSSRSPVWVSWDKTIQIQLCCIIHRNQQPFQHFLILFFYLRNIFSVNGYQLKYNDDH